MREVTTLLHFKEFSSAQKQAPNFQDISHYLIFTWLVSGNSGSLGTFHIFQAIYPEIEADISADLEPGSGGRLS